ncbi:hypothetical protein LCGC14_1535430, partial [marine sediment metagenome]
MAQSQATQLRDIIKKEYKRCAL